MAFVKKTWKDRIVQYANRRLLTKSGGEVEQVTVTRDEGTISEAGDQFNASNMNDLEQRVKDGFDDMQDYVDDGLSDKADTSDLSNVATSGNYNDLLNKPITYGGTLTDLNSSSRTTKTCTLYTFGGDAINSPSGTAGGWLLSMINENTTNYGSQLALTNAGLYFRKLAGGSFQAWTTLAT